MRSGEWLQHDVSCEQWTAINLSFSVTAKLIRPALGVNRSLEALSMKIIRIETKVSRDGDVVEGPALLLKSGYQAGLTASWLPVRDFISWLESRKGPPSSLCN